MWSFVSPRIVFGEDALDALSEVRGRRALIVTDAGIVAAGLQRPVLDRLRDAGFDTRIFDEVESDPSVQTIERGAEIARDYEPDWIVGLGGGSSMDAAKAIWVFYERPDLLAADINPFIDLGLRKKARLITVPTTSGTGSEATWMIVLTDPVEGRKMGLGNRECVADLAVVDPSMAAGMPPQLTADTGLDALTHAVEGYTCTWRSDLTDGLCAHAASEIFEFLPLAFADGDDMEARTRMHHAATAAGLGFGNAFASLAHAMGHAIGAVHHVPHGRAVGLCVPYTLEFVGREAPERLGRLSRLVGLTTKEGLAGARVLPDAIRDLTREIGNPTSLLDAGVSRNAFEETLERMVASAENDTQIITSARAVTTEELRRLFEYAFEGRSVDF
jgi:alcohol dehydrogenase class IV